MFKTRAWFDHMPTTSTLETKYGLPSHVSFCTTCVISNQRPNSAIEFAHNSDSKKSTIHFDEQGVCDACRVAELKTRVDWNERERQLEDLLGKHRSSNGSFDCIVPGSGGKDSFYFCHSCCYLLFAVWQNRCWSDNGVWFFLHSLFLFLCLKNHIQKFRP